MTERDQINVIVDNLYAIGKNELGIELTRIYDKLLEESAKNHDKVRDARDYLMQVEPSDLNVESCLIALGYNAQGF